VDGNKFWSGNAGNDRSERTCSRVREENNVAGYTSDVTGKHISTSDVSVCASVDKELKR